MSDAGAAPSADPGPWHPGIASQIPLELRHLCSIFRPENVFSTYAGVTELQQLTGLAASELVAFRPQRLLLHELLIRVTADFSVPDGLRIGDLGINFREMSGVLLRRFLLPRMETLTAAFEEIRREVQQVIRDALVQTVAGTESRFMPVPAAAPRGGAFRFFGRLIGKSSPSAAAVSRHRVGDVSSRPVVPAPGSAPSLAGRWGPEQIAEYERKAAAATDQTRGVAYRALARVMSALFTTNGRAWGTQELILALATDMACNALASDVIGRLIEPILQDAAREAGYQRLPHQERPVVINTKGPSASGKSTLRPLQKKMTGAIGLRWSDFALISPDIWRKQLLDYASLGAAYKYAGAFTSDELQIVDQKLDRYMARKHRHGEITHLLIDRFRFDSFAPDSDEAGSNLLTRFGDTVYLFFMITPPESLVERAWHRGLEFGRYKAVDDTLAHSVEAYAGMPDVFFTWVQRADKRIQFEFLDNSVHLGERPRTVAFGGHTTFNVLDVKALLDIERFGRVNVNAHSPVTLYPQPQLLQPQLNMGFLQRCLGVFREICFAEQSTGRIYLRIESGRPVMIDREVWARAEWDPDARAALHIVAGAALDSAALAIDTPQFLQARDGALPVVTIGQWGPEAPADQSRNSQ